MSEFTPVEIPTAGQWTDQVASRVPMNQETSSRVADEPVPGQSDAGNPTR